VNKGEGGGDVLNDGLWNHLTWRVSNQLNYFLLGWLFGCLDESTFDGRKGGGMCRRGGGGETVTRAVYAAINIDY